LISVYCDGSAHARPNLPGGWAYVIVQGEVMLATASGGARRATNNQMELTAAIEALKACRALNLAPPFELVSDSRHCLDIARGAYFPKKDTELASQLRTLASELNIVCRWVAGHRGDPWNERCDALAHDAKQELVPARVRRKQARL